MSGETPAVVLPEGGADRRVRKEVRVVVPAELQEGWLAFQNGEERRRLAPIPADWSTLDEAALLALLEKADRISDGRSGEQS